MNAATEIDELFAAATSAGTKASADPKPIQLPPIPDTPRPLQRLVNVQMPALAHSILTLEQQRAAAARTDGRIIGTGEADFTKGNTCYKLNYKGKPFQLVDVPGIEGDETKYAHMVKAAVAKAHLVFYVNGTNKKPEKATAEKIRRYLHRGTQVCPIVNVRGNADAYEFEEDRAALANHGSCGAALEQTTEVLRSVLTDDVLLPGYCVQGLLGFSSLAMTKGKTTIHTSREHDLVVHQRKYVKYFGSTKNMFAFSQMQEIARVLHKKLERFKEDIVESNKVKVREMLAENVHVLSTLADEHKKFLGRVQPEFDKCREAIEGALQTFERVMTAGRKNLWSEFFNDMSDQADSIVADHFGDNDEITARLDKAFKRGQAQVADKLNQQMEEHVKILQDSLGQAMQRLAEDVRRVEFQQRVRVEEPGTTSLYRSATLDMDFGIKGWGSVAFNIGSFAMTGAGIGSSFPVIGTAIGAVVGALVGALASLGHYFLGKEKRIRAAQGQVQEKIDEARDRVMGGLAQEQKKIIDPVRRETTDTVLNQVNTMQANLVRPLKIIERQITLLTNIQHQLEKMSYGTIQAIQH
ncbi:GTPase [Massilia cellulosiltytica]|uniref:GTPase n=1 Tax=Massilia cellulosiltytica TaxID=2683234 RepID=UPI0019236478|nr:GTPase [Telluria cellulosilytica]